MVRGRRLEVRAGKDGRLEDEKLRRCGPSAFGGLRFEAKKIKELKAERIIHRLISHRAHSLRPIGPWVCPGGSTQRKIKKLCDLPLSEL